MRLSSLVLNLTLAAALSVMAGCPGPKNFNNENDDLRSRVLQLEDEVSSLRAQRDELAAKLAEIARTAPGLPQDVLDALPRVAALEIGALSGFQRPAGASDGTPPDRIVVYLQPLDGRRRFTQVAGTVGLDVTWLEGSASDVAEPTNGRPPPRRLAAARFAPAEVREAYRSGVTGTHYAFELPLADGGAAVGSTPGTLVVRAELSDAITGQTHRTERLIRVRRP